MQLAYVQGVSNWNFDVAELKARASLEDHLPAVPEREPPLLAATAFPLSPHLMLILFSLESNSLSGLKDAS